MSPKMDHNKSLLIVFLGVLAGFLVGNIVSVAASKDVPDAFLGCGAVGMLIAYIANRKGILDEKVVRAIIPFLSGACALSLGMVALIYFNAVIYSNVHGKFVEYLDLYSEIFSGLDWSLVLLSLFLLFMASLTVVGIYLGKGVSSGLWDEKPERPKIASKKKKGLGGIYHLGFGLVSGAVLGFIYDAVGKDVVLFSTCGLIIGFLLGESNVFASFFGWVVFFISGNLALFLSDRLKDSIVYVLPFDYRVDTFIIFVVGFFAGWKWNYLLSFLENQPDPDKHPTVISSAGGFFSGLLAFSIVCHSFFGLVEIPLFVRGLADSIGSGAVAVVVGALFGFAVYLLVRKTDLKYKNYFFPLLLVGSAFLGLVSGKVNETAYSVFSSVLLTGFIAYLAVRYSGILDWRGLGDVLCIIVCLLCIPSFNLDVRNFNVDLLKMLVPLSGFLLGALFFCGVGYFFGKLIHRFTVNHIQSDFFETIASILRLKTSPKDVSRSFLLLCALPGGVLGWIAFLKIDSSKAFFPDIGLVGFLAIGWLFYRLQKNLLKKSSDNTFILSLFYGGVLGWFVVTNYGSIGVQGYAFFDLFFGSVLGLFLGGVFGLVFGLLPAFIVFSVIELVGGLWAGDAFFFAIIAGLVAIVTGWVGGFTMLGAVTGLYLVIYKNKRC